MEFEKKLNGKILDPIHGIIRITDIEKDVINHPLYQRLRNVKQNTFLYKVFPSAMHSRFEHSLGVMNFSYRMIENLIINSYRYENKYHDEFIFNKIDSLPDSNIQELRLAALLHDVGHGPMSHQFDSFMLSKNQLMKYLGDEFADIYALIDDNDKVEHEHISLIFIKKIFCDLVSSNDKYSTVNVDNIIKIVESKYKDAIIKVKLNNECYDLLPLFTSLISSCPIDSDRMDYLLRDGYFSGVKCGVYNIDRLLMSIVPVHVSDKVHLAYKESCLDSISEFLFSRESLFSQVYYHKTNRSFSSMLSKVCECVKSKDAHSQDLFSFLGDDCGENLNKFIKFYEENSDELFLNKTIPELVKDDDNLIKIINDIRERKPWKKIYESKIYLNNVTISTIVNKDFIGKLKKDLNDILSDKLSKYEFMVDIMSDNAFKDVDKTEIKLLSKKSDNTYKCNSIRESGEKLDMFQSIRYFIRIFVERKHINDEVLKSIIDIENKQKELYSSMLNIKNQSD